MNKLKERACVVERLDIALVDLVAVPDDPKFDKERKIKQERLEKYIKLAKKVGNISKRYEKKYRRWNKKNYFLKWK